MRLEPFGGTIFQVDMTNVSSHGSWLLALGRELFLFGLVQDKPIFRVETGGVPSASAVEGSSW